MGHGAGAMKALIRRIGNSRGVLIPKSLLAQAGFGEQVEMSYEDDAIVLRKPEHRSREGWAESARSVAEMQGDELAWPEFANEDDEQLQW